VTELRAALIIGSGSASFEMLRYLVEVLPVMLTPRWIENRCQPIGVRDVLRWLVAAADRTDTGAEVLEVGGPDVLTYRQMMTVYAEVAGLPRRWIVPIPVLTPKLSSLWVGLVTPLPSALARPLVEGLVNEVIVTNPSDVALSDPPAMGFRSSVELALGRSNDQQVVTRWSDAALPGAHVAEPLPTDPEWAGGERARRREVGDHRRNPRHAVRHGHRYRGRSRVVRDPSAVEHSRLDRRIGRRRGDAPRASSP
jgi:hypothetical protein